MTKVASLIENYKILSNEEKLLKLQSLLDIVEGKVSFAYGIKQALSTQEVTEDFLINAYTAIINVGQDAIAQKHERQEKAGKELQEKMLKEEKKDKQEAESFLQYL